MLRNGSTHVENVLQSPIATYLEGSDRVESSKVAAKHMIGCKDGERQQKAIRSWKNRVLLDGTLSGLSKMSTSTFLPGIADPDVKEQCLT